MHDCNADASASWVASSDAPVRAGSAPAHPYAHHALEYLGVGDSDSCRKPFKNMPCCHPVQAFKTGHETVNGKDEYIRMPDGFYGSYLPLTKTRKHVNLPYAPHAMIPGEGICLTEPVEQPCGKCVGCRMDNALDWKIRCCLELQYRPECYFVTLTYDNFHLPFSKSTGEPELCYPDVQKFFKRLRLEIGPFRYYGCGEYGKEENTRRPHYHLLIWAPLRDLVPYGVQTMRSPVLEKCWPFGNSVVKFVEPAMIAYVCGYVEKKQADPDWDDYPVKPFTFMSTKPAIGAEYFIANYESIKLTKKVYCVANQGLKAQAYRLPRYFKRLLDDEPWYQEWKECMKKQAEKAYLTEYAVYGCFDRVTLGYAKESAYYERLSTQRMKTL